MLWIVNFTPAMFAYTGAVATIVIPAISNGFLLYSAVEGAQQIEILSRTSIHTQLDQENGSLET